MAVKLATHTHTQPHAHARACMCVYACVRQICKDMPIAMLIFRRWDVVVVVCSNNDNAHLLLSMLTILCSICVRDEFLFHFLLFWTLALGRDNDNDNYSIRRRREHATPWLLLLWMCVCFSFRGSLCLQALEFLRFCFLLLSWWWLISP